MNEIKVGINNTSLKQLLINNQDIAANKGKKENNYH